MWQFPLLLCHSLQRMKVAKKNGEETLIRVTITDYYETIKYNSCTKLISYSKIVKPEFLYGSETLIWKQENKHWKYWERK